MADKMPEGVKTVMYWTLGLGVVALIGLVMLILFGNLSGNVGFGQDTLSVVADSFTITYAYKNVTDLTYRVNPSLSNVVLINASGGETIASGNYTTLGGTIKAVTTTYNNSAVNLTATLSYDEAGKVDTDNLIANYTTSVTNTGKQFPVVGTIVGIALLLVILIGILTFAIRKLMGVTSDSGSSNGTFG